MSRLVGKVALITGASKGIGTATRQRIGGGRASKLCSRRSPPPALPVLGRYSQKENQLERRFK